MGLPIISHPTFSLILPSTKQKIEFRPFLVKEEKILLVAQASGEQLDIVRAIKQVISNCIVTPGVDVEEFATFDLEYFFIKIRSKSVQNIVKLSYRDNEDQKVYDVEVNLDDIEVVQQKETSSRIKVDENHFINLKYPRLSLMSQMEQIDNPIDFNFAIMQSCIDTVEYNNEVLHLSDHSIDEAKQYLDSLDVPAYQEIQSFIDAMPQIRHTVSYTNSNGKEISITLNSLTDFFSLG